MRPPPALRGCLRVTCTAARSEKGLMPWAARIASNTVGKACLLLSALLPSAGGAVPVRGGCNPVVASVGLRLCATCWLESCSSSASTSRPRSV